MNGEIEQFWFRSGQAALADGDDHLADDDFDGACLRFLLAAYCFDQAWCSSIRPPGGRHEYRSAFHYALYAAGPLLPDPNGHDESRPDQSHASRTASGSP